MKKAIAKLSLAAVLGTLVLGFSTTPAQAQNQGNTLTLDPFVGGFMLPAQNLNHGVYYGLRVGYNITENFAAEAMGGYFGTENWDYFLPFEDNKVDAWRFGVDALYHFNPDGIFVPFLAAGGGFLNFENPGWEDEMNGVLDYGAGAKIYLADYVAVRGDARHDFLFHEGEVENGVELTVGLSFMIGGEKRPVAAREAEAATPVVICTSPDAGVTGVAVDRDIVATFNVPIERSALSTSSFTVKAGDEPVPGKVAFNGSNAAIFDPDKNLKEGTTYTATVAAGINGKYGGKTKAPHVWKFTTVPPQKEAVFISLEDTHFEFDQAKVTKKGAQILDENIKILKANPDVRIRIAGYTSAKGTKEHNQQLSERRAEAVKTYLVDGGIAKDRLVTIGYGRTRPAEFEPIPDNIYSKEAQANMRVLFEVIVK